ncbi:MAG TPA: Rid family detoxifying hydrolase [Gemmatimonadales bacterium]|jgi:2-iminobutanoate/2-iminopropanoate deaminase|nr:Rid family detoxifying hydrolase [Gemmatimonadales bacterium]
MDAIQTANAPIPSGHYSQAVVHNGLVFVAGQLPIDPKDPKRPPGSAEEQTEQALHNVAAILEAAGSALDRVLQLTIFVADIAHWSAVNATVARVFGNHKPARAVVPCGTLNRGFQIEIVTTAALR